MKGVVREETVAAPYAHLASVFPRHNAHQDAFDPAGAVIGIDIFKDPVTNLSMAIFASLDSGRRLSRPTP